MTKEYVILVDEQDNDIGVMEKMKAHQDGLLHRAFSVFIFNDQDELLLQQRAISKYHSGGLWTNTCCSHPRPNETIKDAANRRLFEEMGMSCDLKIKTSFIYKTPFDNGLTEHELDYVLIGTTNENPQINKEEVESYKWMLVKDIKKDISDNPDHYTSWFKIALEKLF
ncbi:MAG TPA: isopentenyl-diphosphate Delta-isomerase [Bacteroidia bacterium]|nr:isopentenyl-diphosphate Delta-isomerase [Bacteroidia bacterium]